ncbi:phospholipase B1, membrane-associated-like [Ylistrum balloti]|uniref:phospholipase B1, membrane-associated-like n=1 Tax=Ylistrum balloti TaxID=509963 RepID=UPI002905E539|nr:phospholipase B1, membrane-associated-like [Ylistrum balloti]
MFDFLQHSKKATYPIPSFTCSTGTSSLNIAPRSVHELHPSDIKVVAAMGDSLTAGNGIDALTIIGDFTEYRGRSWSIGGDGNLNSRLTLPNILKLYNPNVRGWSTGTGNVNSAGAHLNVAVTGSIAADLPDQARMLVSRINADPNINAATDWKLVTLFIGGNDMCEFCIDPVKFSAANYANHIAEALDILHDNLARTFVNVVLIFDIAPIAAMDGGFFCNLAHTLVCACGKDKGNADLLYDASVAYQMETTLLISSGRYDTRDDFTAVIQPFFSNTVPPKSTESGEIDLTYFSPDCFHFNAKGHAASALSLWNNMVESYSEKKQEWHLNEPFYCPGIQTLGVRTGPYLATSLNSA